MRSPKISKSDKAFVKDLINREVLFPMISDRNVRLMIYQRLYRVPCMIPSLFTFFEDTKWLEPCAKVIRGLLPPRFGTSIRTAVFKMYTGKAQLNNILNIQDSAGAMKGYIGNEHQAVECGYLQLWMAAWRGFPDMVSITPRKDVGKPKPQVKALNEQYWNKLATMASQFGFESEELNRLQKKDMDRGMTEDFVKQLRPVEFYGLSDQELTTYVTQICSILRNITPQLIIKGAYYVPEDAEIRLDVPVESRCGRPHEKSFQHSRGKFFMKDMYGLSSDAYLTHFRINRDIFRAFFGLNSPFSWEPYVSQRPQRNSRNVINKVSKRSSRLSKSFVLNENIFKEIPSHVFGNEGFSDDPSACQTGHSYPPDIQPMNDDAVDILSPVSVVYSPSSAEDIQMIENEKTQKASSMLEKKTRKKMEKAMEEDKRISKQKRKKINEKSENKNSRQGIPLTEYQELVVPRSEIEQTLLPINMEEDEMPIFTKSQESEIINTPIPINMKEDEKPIIDLDEDEILNFTALRNKNTSSSTNPQQNEELLLSTSEDLKSTIQGTSLQNEAFPLEKIQAIFYPTELPWFASFDHLLSYVDSLPNSVDRAELFKALIGKVDRYPALLKNFSESNLDDPSASHLKTSSQSVPNKQSASHIEVVSQSVPYQQSGFQTEVSSQSVPDKQFTLHTEVAAQSVTNQKSDTKVTSQFVPHQKSALQIEVPSQSVSDKQFALHAEVASQSVTNQQSAPHTNVTSQSHKQFGPHFEVSSGNVSDKQSDPHIVSNKQSALHTVVTSQAVSENQSAPDIEVSSQFISSKQSSVPNRQSAFHTEVSSQSILVKELSPSSPIAKPQSKPRSLTPATELHSSFLISKSQSKSQSPSSVNTKGKAIDSSKHHVVSQTEIPTKSNKVLARREPSAEAKPVDLATAWTINCTTNRLFLVNAEDATWFVSIDNDESTQEWFARLANEYYFCCEDLIKKSLKTIKPEKYNQYVRDSKNKSGVIYAFRHRLHNLNNNMITKSSVLKTTPYTDGFKFRSTTDMLTIISARYQNKRKREPDNANLDIRTSKKKTDMQTWHTFCHIPTDHWIDRDRRIEECDEDETDYESAHVQNVNHEQGKSQKKIENHETGEIKKTKAHERSEIHEKNTNQAEIEEEL